MDDDGSYSDGKESPEHTEAEDESRALSGVKDVVDRRAFLAAGGGLAVPLLSGCIGGDGTETPGTDSSPTAGGDPPDSGTATPTDGETPGGTDDPETETPDGTDDPGGGSSPEYLWRLGDASGTSADFGDQTNAVDSIGVPGNWAEIEDWSAVPRGLSGETNPSLELNYDLEAVPEGGARFSARITNAHGCGVPQMAVFSNDVMVGNVQVAGLEEVEVVEEIDFRKTTSMDATAPLWVRITREGDRITGAYSPDGDSWTELESLEMDIAEDAYIGVTAASQRGAVGTAELDSIEGGTDSWENQAIGDVAADGSVSYGTKSMSVEASPGEVYGERDAFRYVYRKLDGDDELVARVASQGGDGDLPASAGVMIRESLDPAAPTAATVLDTDGNVEFRWRPVLPDLPEMQYTDTYEVYVPPEFLQTGTNNLKLRADRGLYTGQAADSAMYWNWETLALESMTDRPAEPIHGRHVRMGTALDSGGTTGEGRSFSAVTDYMEPLLEWLGIAYSGNTVRMGDFDFHREYFEKLRDLNTGACVLDIQNYTGGDPEELEGGELTAEVTNGIDSFLQEYGDLVEYYQIGNEPSTFGGSLEFAIESAKYVQTVKSEYASHMDVVAPGWFFTGYDDYPTGWAADPEQRRRVEQHCDMASGHAYGKEYCNGRGANLVENVITFQGTGDRGFPKPMIATEMGTNDGHVDHEELDSSQPRASMFDRICRSHVGFADQFTQFAAFYTRGFGMFEPPETFVGANAPSPEEIAVYPGVEGEDPRVKTFRRLALAYATHGEPLSYSYDNRSDIEGRAVYVRAVDTSTLETPTTGAGSEKLLVNLVNFEAESAEVAVTVTMPEARAYEGDRYGEVTNGTTYADAHSRVQFEADPAISLSDSLGPGQAVQYILE
jgi:hypothetical protein